MRPLILAASLLAIATPAFAWSDSLDAKIERINSIAEGARQAAHEALAEKYRSMQMGVSARCAKLGGAKIGMGTEGIRRSCWGEPLRINTRVTARGTHEQWVYDSGYLYLDDGVVTSIQTSR